MYQFPFSSDYYPIKITEPLYDKTNENNYAPIEDSDRTGRIRVLAVRSMGSKLTVHSVLRADCED